jgi:two-component system nitrogen regulation sensor histidine kinase GlnL
VQGKVMFTNVINLNKIKKHYQQALPNQMVTAVVVLDRELAICYVNPAAEALLVKSLSKIYRLPIGQVFYNTPINSHRLQQLLTTGQEFSDSDVTIEFFDQRKITVEITASSVTFEQCPHILLEFKQIDQQKQISAEAFQQQQWESARDLIRGLAHEIKNPLGGLRGAAQLLDLELNLEQKEYTAMIIEQADRLTNLVDRLLGPNNRPLMKLQNIHIVIEKVFQLSKFDNPKDITFARDYDPSIPELTFDQDKLQQTVINIVHNAMQALNGEGKITLKTRAASNKTINGKRIKLCAEISIIDNGPGIPEHIRSTLFYPMVSGSASSTGLGLSICQTIIHQHHGKLSCKSRPGHTEFTILIPFESEKK